MGFFGGCFDEYVFAAEMVGLSSTVGFWELDGSVCKVELLDVQG